MATLTVATPVAGNAPVTTPVAASAGGDTFPTIGLANGGTQTNVLRVINASGGSINVTLVQANPCSAGATTPTHDFVQAVAAGVTRDIVIPALCVNNTTGNCAITYSAVTSVTVAALAYP